MEQHLLNLDPDAVVEEMPEYNPDREEEVSWEDGVEYFADWPAKKLWEYLGVSEIPFFNERYDSLNGRDGWSDANVAEEIEQSGEKLVPRWHQLVGIAKMLTNAFTRKPVLLMDDVGIGKTLQVVGLIVVLSYYREYHLQHKKFPGYFGKHHFLAVSTIYSHCHRSAWVEVAGRGRDQQHRQQRVCRDGPALPAEPVPGGMPAVSAAAELRPADIRRHGEDAPDMVDGHLRGEQSPAVASDRDRDDVGT